MMWPETFHELYFEANTLAGGKLWLMDYWRDYVMAAANAHERIDRHTPFISLGATRAFLSERFEKCWRDGATLGFAGVAPKPGETGIPYWQVALKRTLALADERGIGRVSESETYST